MGTAYDPDSSAELYISTSPIITSPLVATGTTGLPFSYHFENANATSLDVDGLALPPGLSFDPGLAAIVGTPAMQGTFNVQLTASNPVGATSAMLVLTIQPAPISGPVIISATSAKSRTGTPFSFQVITSGASPLARLTVTGLPAGLSADSASGLISGMPPKDSSSAVNLTVTDGSETATGTLELTFSSELSLPLIVSSTSVPLFPNLAFTYTILTASSDPFGKYYDFVGTLPPGLKLNPVTGKISGTFESPTRDVPGLALPGEVIGNVQLFAGNYHGTCSSPLVFRVLAGSGQHIDPAQRRNGRQRSHRRFYHTGQHSDKGRGSWNRSIACPGRFAKRSLP